MLSLYILYTILFIVSVWDLRTLKIPNAFIVGGWLIGLVVSFIENGFNGLFESFVAMLVVGVLLLPIWALSQVGIRTIGAGDVKLFMVVSVFLGISMTLQIVWYSILLGAILFLFIIKPKRIVEMVQEFLYLSFYFIPPPVMESKKKISYALPIFLIVLGLTGF